MQLVIHIVLLKKCLNRAWPEHECNCDLFKRMTIGSHLPHYIEALDKIFCWSKTIFEWQKLYRKQNATG